MNNRPIRSLRHFFDESLGVFSMISEKFTRTLAWFNREHRMARRLDREINVLKTIEYATRAKTEHDRGADYLERF